MPSVFQPNVQVKSRIAGLVFSIKPDGSQSKRQTRGHVTGTIVESVDLISGMTVQFDNGVVVNLPSNKLSIVVGKQDSAPPPQ
jgi:hypothetical protein